MASMTTTPRWWSRRRIPLAPEGDPRMSEIQQAARLLGLELDWRLVAEWVPAARASCPLTTDPGYTPVGPCCLPDDGAECPMAGIAAGCIYGKVVPRG